MRNVFKRVNHEIKLSWTTEVWPNEYSVDGLTEEVIARKKVRAVIREQNQELPGFLEVLPVGQLRVGINRDRV